MTSILPTLSILASALKLEHLCDASMLRAADNALGHLAADPIFEFDGSELRIVSQSEADLGTWYATDGVSCTCKGNKHPMCKHRALYRLLLAREVLIDPLFLRAKIIEQVVPDVEPADDRDVWGDEADDARPSWADRAAALRQIHADADEWYAA